jgi:hypothetical protein
LIAGKAENPDAVAGLAGIDRFRRSSGKDHFADLAGQALKNI